jgi:hypothetical protein
MIVALLNKIQNEVVRAFGFRVYNTFKSVILPIVLSLIILELEKTPGDLSCLVSGEFWYKILYAVIVALIGGAVAGLDKVKRMESK